MTNMKIGDIVYIFDSNHRVYPPKKDNNAYSSGGPIYREHFVKRQIVGETTQSWIVAFEGAQADVRYATKHKKKEPRNGLYTLEQVEEQVWMHNNQYHVSEAVRHADYATLRQIASLLNYKERFNA